MWCFALIKGRKLEVESFNVQEKISDGFHGEAVIYGPGQILLGDQIQLWLSESVWTGYLDSILECIDSATEKYYRVTFCSGFEYIGRSIRCNIYQDIEITALFDTLLEGVKYRFDAVFRRKYEYLFQYHESNADLIRYLVSNNNLYYYIDHAEDEFVITGSQTFGKHNLYFTQIRAPEQLHEYIDAITIKNMANFKEYERFGFSIARPEIPLKTHRTSTGAGIYEEYDTSVTELNQLINNNEQMIPNVEYLLETHNPSIRAAAIVVLHSDQFGGEYFVTKVSHEFNRVKYSNKVVLIKEKLRLPPVRLKQLPNLIATVGDGVYFRESKVKVKFPWSQQQVFIPILLSICGNGYGNSVIPHSGQRVLIIFEGGRPFIAGAFYDGSHLSAYQNNPNVIAIKTIPNQQNKYNEFVLDETVGQELVSIVAAKDMHETIERNKEIKLLDGDLTVQVLSGATRLFLEGERSVNEVQIMTGDNVVKIDTGSNVLRVTRGDSIVEVTDGKIKFCIQNGELEIATPTLVISSNDMTLRSKNLDILTSSGHLQADTLSITANGVVTIAGSLINLNTR